MKSTHLVKMPRPKSVSCLQDLCAEAVAANLADVSWTLLFAGGDSRNDDNPFETLRNIVKHYEINCTFFLEAICFIFFHSFNNFEFNYGGCW